MPLSQIVTVRNNRDFRAVALQALATAFFPIAYPNASGEPSRMQSEVLRDVTGAILNSICAAGVVLMKADKAPHSAKTDRLVHESVRAAVIAQCREGAAYEDLREDQKIACDTAVMVVPKALADAGVRAVSRPLDPDAAFWWDCALAEAQATTLDSPTPTVPGHYVLGESTIWLHGANAGRLAAAGAIAPHTL